ncbi:MAG: AAA family ATPase [Micromonosporaceae bacterium]|nr:AAA family ATPase [Micromonosporaceae bacterium]
MTVVSVLNYKGGVGKTTLTANIGAELASRGKSILLIDLDPQASLTFSFYEPEVWEKSLAYERTIQQWFGSLLNQPTADPLHQYVVTPPAVNRIVQANGGRLDLIASHLDLVDVDLEFAHRLGGATFSHVSPNFLRLHRSLRDALDAPAFDAYDLIMIDCPPNFTMTTRTAVVASDYLVVPAKPDYLSTLGFDYLRRRLSMLITEYNKAVSSPAEQINPIMLGIVFTMIQYGGAEPIIAQRGYLERPTRIEVPRFDQTLRDSKTLFGPSSEDGIPAVLRDGGNEIAQFELQQIASELYAKVRN